MRGSAGALLAAALCWPQSVQAGAWSLREGRLAAKASLLHLSSDLVFADDDDVTLLGCSGAIESGDRRPYDCATGGRFGVTAIYVDTGLGLGRGWEVGFQLPVVLETSFENRSGLSGRDGGLGDVRVYGRKQVALGPIAGALRLEAKAPTGNFSVDEAVPPLGEGQWDVTAEVSAGWAQTRFYAGADLGFRWRAPNPSNDVDVGDELLALAEAGLHVFEWLTVPLKTDLIYGFESTQTDVPTPRPRRWLWRLQPGLRIRWPGQAWGLEGVVFVPLAGAGYPANPTFSLALFGGGQLWN